MHGDGRGALAADLSLTQQRQVTRKPSMNALHDTRGIEASNCGLVSFG
jgi:hypothetical protein